MNITQSILAAAAKLSNAETVAAHCDLPCGIYDPHLAQIGALTTIRMIDVMKETMDHLNGPDHGGQEEMELRNNFIRAVHIKEEHAELCKREVRILWGDYFKQEHLDKYPELHGLVHKIMQLGSKIKQTTDRTQSEQLLESINRLAEIFWETKGVATKKVKAPYKPGLDMVLPDLQ